MDVCEARWRLTLQQRFEIKVRGVEGSRERCPGSGMRRNHVAARTTVFAGRLTVEALQRIGLLRGIGARENALSPPALTWMCA